MGSVTSTSYYGASSASAKKQSILQRLVRSIFLFDTLSCCLAEMSSFSVISRVTDCHLVMRSFNLYIFVSRTRVCQVQIVKGLAMGTRSL